jgi:hypothetical protein
MPSIFEEATRKGIRFDTSKHSGLCVEDVWEVGKNNLQELKTMYIGLKKKLNELTEISIGDELDDEEDKETKAIREDLELKTSILRHIYLTIKKEIKKSEKAEANRKLKERLKGYRYEQQEAKYKEMDPAELDKLIDAL